MSAKKCHGVVMSGGQCNFRYAKSKIVCFVLTVNGEINVFLPPGHSLKLCLATCKASQPATTLLSQLKEIFFSWLSGVSYGTLGWLVVLAVPWASGQQLLAGHHPSLRDVRRCVHPTTA